jgi:hypothetical protein
MVDRAGQRLHEIDLEGEVMTEHVHKRGDSRIFVFGSNRLGIHGGGAARYAHESLGAVWGVGEGLTGRTYALPTCIRPGEPLTIEAVAIHVGKFLHHAAAHPDARFFVSAVGCGIAGFSEDEIAPLFADAPSNCDLPPGWRKS